MSDDREDKIQHTDALKLCSELTKLQSSAARFAHELVLHYAATGVPSHKMNGQIGSLKRQMERTKERLEVIEQELEELDR